jgi:hypothetical protein
LSLTPAAHWSINHETVLNMKNDPQRNTFVIQGCGGPRLLMAAAASILLITVPAILHGRISNRWSAAADLEEAARRLANLPASIENWRQVGEDTPFPDYVVRELHLAGYINRIYKNSATGRTVTLALMVGPPAPLCRHPPELCYESRANEPIGPPMDVSVTAPDGVEHRFRRLRFRSEGNLARDISIYYGFTRDGTWEIPAYPRLKFGSRPLVYKVQILTEGLGDDDSRMAEPIADFARGLITAFRSRGIELLRPE